MKRVITFACSVAMVGACSGTPAVQGSQLAAAPASSASESTRPGAAAAPSSADTTGATATSGTGPGSQVKKLLGSDTREVTLPAGTVLPIDLETAVGSDISRVEQAVSGRLRRAITVGGGEVLPAGTIVSGHVTAARRPGKVKGRGLIAMRFTKLDTPGAGSTSISSATISRLAPATKEKDTLKVVAPAAAGAVIGRIAGGKSGAAKGAVIGGGAGAGYVLSTRGKEVRLGKGANLAVRLTAPVSFRVPVR